MESVQNFKGGQNELIKKLREIKSLRDEYLSVKNEVQNMILNTQIRSSKHNHGLVLLYANNDWICEICKSNKQKTLRINNVSVMHSKSII